jgi:hypothetical protein
MSVILLRFKIIKNKSKYMENMSIKQLPTPETLSPLIRTVANLTQLRLSQYVTSDADVITSEDVILINAVNVLVLNI